MKRRDLLKAASATAGALAISPVMARAQDVPEAGRRKTDVLVIGGGTAGCIAALQAARAGARTTLIEMGSQLGGTTTTGGVSFPGLFHAWGKQVIAGIGWEMVQDAVRLDGGQMPDFSRTPAAHYQHQVRINGPLYAALLEEACLQAGVSLAYYQFPLSATATKHGWSLEIVGKGLRYSIVCRQLIDCTGGADVVGLAGLPRMREETTQPGTLIFRLGGYHVADLDAAEIQRRYLQALADGELEHSDARGPRTRFVNFLASGGDNAQHVLQADSSTADSQTQANIAGRRSVLRLLRFIRSLPGCERAQIQKMMQETAVRETYRIVGQATITHDDYTSGRLFEDAVCYSFYPIDLHTRDGVVPKPLAPGTVPTVPLGALVPQGSRHLLVAGRSVSSDRLANSALRVQASCMAMGQAAGAAAALAIQQDTSPGAIDLEELHTLLEQHNAIVPR
jgi:hypothetical protein